MVPSPSPIFRRPRQGNNVLTPGGIVPIAKIAGLYRPEDDALGTVQVGQIRLRCEIEFFDVRFAIVARIVGKGSSLRIAYGASINSNP